MSIRPRTPSKGREGNERWRDYLENNVSGLPARPPGPSISTLHRLREPGVYPTSHRTSRDLTAVSSDPRRWLSLFLIPSFQFIDSCLGRNNKRNEGGDIRARFCNYRVAFDGAALLLAACYFFVQRLLHAIPPHFPDADCPFQIVNGSHISLEFSYHAGKFSRILFLPQRAKILDSSSRTTLKGK
jgi:hypothetical protein